MNNLAVQRFGSVVVMVQNENTPTAVEWSDFLKILASAKSETAKLKILVETPGGSPSAAQRKRLADLFGGASPFRVAVVSDSIKVRFVHVTISLFYEYLRLFSRREIEQAFAHLQLTEAERDQVAEALQQKRLTVATVPKPTGSRRS